MMRTLRDKKTMQVILWMVVVFFVGTIFLAWGMKFTGPERKDPNTIAKVGDISITYDSFSKAYQSASDRLYGSNGNEPSSDQQNRLHDQVLDSLIDEAVLRQTAEKMGLTVPNEELMADIQHQPYFQDDKGQFDKNRYYQILQENQITPAEYEAAERDSKLIQKIRSVLSDGLLYPRNELETFTALLSRDVKANELKLDPSAYEKAVTYTEDDLKEDYSRDKSLYDHPARVKVRHILLSVSSAPTADPLAAQKKLSDFRAQILSGKAKFSDLAKKYSDDGGTKDKGGELGWISKGTTVQEFEDAVFKLKKGQITEPFKTQYGYHIAQVEDIEKEYKSTFEAVRDKVLEKYKKEKANEKVLALAEKITGQLKEKKSLSEIAQSLDLADHTTPWFNAKSEIPGIKDAKDATAELAGLYEGDWKGPLSLGSSEYFFQITDVRNGKTTSVTTDPGFFAAAQELKYARQESWLDEFLKAQRQKLGVKIFQAS